jgi:Glycosyl transferase family 2
VTAVVPCYNYGHYLTTAVTSVLSQPGVEVEVIVIDDASPDGSASVARDLAAADSRVRAILHSRNRGHIATYNEGLEQAQGDYVVLLSADDALTPGALRRATALLESEPSVAFVYGFPQECGMEFPPVREGVRSWSIWTGAEWVARRCSAGNNCIKSPEVVMRTAVQRAIGGYDPELPHSGDLEMWLRAATLGNVGRVNGPAQAYYRTHDQSMHGTTYRGALTDLEALLSAFEKALMSPGGRAAGGPEMLATAKRALAVSALRHVRSTYLHGELEPDGGEEYFAFATRLWPGVVATRAWRSARRAVAASSHPGHSLHIQARRMSEDTAARVRWRRWRWAGV